MAQEKEGPGGSVIPAPSRIQTRDGTLNRDAKMVNCFMENTEMGPAAVKRPGVSNQTLLPNGVAQGMFLNNAFAYAVQNDIIWKVLDNTPFPIPSITQANERFTFLSDTPPGTTLLKSPTGLWIFNGTTVTKVTDVNYPVITVPGVAYLDGTYYVMTDTGIIHGSALNDPTTWPALSFLAGDAGLGRGAALYRHLNYIVGYFVQGMELYYDAGNSPGIPLSPVSNAIFRTGTPSGYSPQEMDDVSYFVGITGQYGRTVNTLTGLTLQKISTAPIERILNRSNMTLTWASAIKIAGHAFYVLLLQDIGVTLVYDSTTNEWHEWSSMVGSNEQYFVGVNYLATANADLWQNIVIGQVLSMTEGATGDYSGQILARIVTIQHDFGTSKTKRFPTLNFMADTQNTTMNVRHTDDDYQTWSVYRTVNLSNKRKQLQRCGRSRRRAWEFLHTDVSSPFKLYWMEIEGLLVGPN